MHKPVRRVVLLYIRLVYTQDDLEGQQHQHKHFQKPALPCTALHYASLKSGQFLAAINNYLSRLSDVRKILSDYRVLLDGCVTNEMYQGLIERPWSLLQLNPGNFHKFWSKCHIYTAIKQYSFL